MRDGQRAAARKLALEQRHHGAGAAQHVAEPHGDAAHALAGASRAEISSAWQYISASRLEAPITTVGFTALSVEISTIACAPDRAGRVGDVAGAGGVGQQPFQRVVLDHRHVLQRGGVEHQFGPQCPRTPRGCAPRRGCRRSARGGAPAGGSRPVPGRSATARIRRCPAGSACSGPNAATWRASSLPMVPPAPVTMTRRPWISRAMPSRSSGTCGRFSRSSMATGRSSSGCRRRWRRPDPARWGAARGAPAGRSARPASTRPARSAPDRSGVAITSVSGRRPSAASRSSTAPASAMRAEDRLALDAPAGLPASRSPAAPPPGSPAAGPAPGRAGTGRRPRRCRPAGRSARRRRRSRPAARFEHAAVGDAGGAEHHQQGQRVDDGEGRVGRAEAGQRQRRREQHRADRAGGGDGQQVVDAGEAPVLQREAERQAGQQQRRGAQRQQPERCEARRRTGRRSSAPPARPPRRACRPGRR